MFKFTALESLFTACFDICNKNHEWGDFFFFLYSSICIIELERQVL